MIWQKGEGLNAAHAFLSHRELLLYETESASEFLKSLFVKKKTA